MVFGLKVIFIYIEITFNPKTIIMKIKKYFHPYAIWFYIGMIIMAAADNWWAIISMFFYLPITYWYSKKNSKKIQEFLDKFE